MTNKGDLISRDALKKALESNACGAEYYPVARITALIDNAPTVDTDEIYKKGYHNGFFAAHDVPPTVESTYISDMPDDKVKDLQELAIDYGEGIAVFERKRPQGEWRIIADVYCKCPFCSNVEVKFSNYCPECGARLEGGAE